MCHVRAMPGHTHQKWGGQVPVIYIEDICIYIYIYIVYDLLYPLTEDVCLHPTQVGEKDIPKSTKGESAAGLDWIGLAGPIAC